VLGFVWCTDTSDPRHFGPRHFRTSAELSVRHIGTSAEVSRHFGTNGPKVSGHIGTSVLQLLTGDTIIHTLVSQS